jgi:hypothetical protein
MMNKRGERDTGTFYEIMQEYYGKGPDDEKHSSPTKRLISLKNTTFEHKKVMKDNIER